eukprot:412064-Amphidinium_carterae.1
MPQLAASLGGRSACDSPHPLVVTADEFRVLSAMEGGLSSALFLRGTRRSIVIEGRRPGPQNATTFQSLDPPVDGQEPELGEAVLADC